MSKNEPLRCFIAVELDDAVRGALERAQGRLRRTGARVSWTAAPNLHLTLFFLGSISPGRLERVKECVDQTVADVSGFSMEVRGLGFFGSPRSPRILWAGIPDPPASLMQLVQRMGETLEALGFEQETRPFRPHVTLGRVRGKEGVAELTTELAGATNTAFGTVHVERIVVMQSHLYPQGPQYEVRQATALKGA